MVDPGILTVGQARAITGASGKPPVIPGETPLYIFKRLGELQLIHGNGALTDDGVRCRMTLGKLA